jgi:hypothetical protein
MINLCTKLHKPRINSALVTTIRLKNKENYCMADISYFRAYRSFNLAKVTCFSKTYYHTALQDPKVHGTCCSHLTSLHVEFEVLTVVV